MRRTAVYFNIVALATLITWGCATTPAATPNTAEQKIAKTIDVPETAPNPVLVAAKSDPKVPQARTRCEKEITNSKIIADKQLKPIQVHACMYALRPALASCIEAEEKQITLKIVVSKNGDIKNATPIGDDADGKEAKCMAKVVEKSQLPGFTGREVQVIKYPFTFSKASTN